jgi:membrane protein implicated in regulation of membrane protease activity
MSHCSMFDELVRFAFAIRFGASALVAKVLLQVLSGVWGIHIIFMATVTVLALLRRHGAEEAAMD